MYIIVQHIFTLWSIEEALQSIYVYKFISSEMVKNRAHR